MKLSITAILITKNEEQMIENCLKTIQWCDEILVIDDNSTDRTVDIAESYQAKVISYSNMSFAQKRQEGLKRVKTDWIFYIDADERVSPQLAKEIQVNIETRSADVFALHRKNILLGKELQNGNWGGEILQRIFHKDHILSWDGVIHETPVTKGTVKTLNTPLIHLSHRDIISGLKKTVEWTPLEAEELYKANIKPVSIPVILKKGVMEVVRRAVLKKGYKDGQTGLIEAVIQGINRMLVYLLVWERQNADQITKSYKEIEDSLLSEWKDIENV